MSNSAPVANVSPAIFGSLRNGLDAMKVVVVNGRRNEQTATESTSKSTSDWANRADRARKSLGESMRKVYAKLPEISTDIESGNTDPSSSSSVAPVDPTSKSWKDRAKNASQSVANAAQKLKQDGLVESAKGAGDKMKKGIGRASEGATQAGVKLQEKTALISEKAGAKAKEAKHVASKGMHAVGEKAGSVAGNAKNKLSKTGESLKGLSLAAMSPKKLAQVGCVFFLGLSMIAAAFAFLPMIAVAPMGFAALTTMGSLCIMGSIALLKGPESFAKALTKKSKLPFSLFYVTGLLGTLFATLVKRSLVLTAIFGIMQALGLLYFLASYVPGGKACLNQIGRMCRKTAEKCAKWIVG